MSDGSDDGEAFVGKITQKAILFGPGEDVLVCRVDDHWEPPGGTFEYGETLVGGLRRELREELSVDARVGPPVGATYGGWVDDAGEPMVTLLYRCRTDERDVALNDEHDDHAWVAPETARERLGGWLGGRGRRVLDRALALDGEGPFEPRADPYEGTDVDTDELLASLAEARRTSAAELRDEDGQE